MIRVKHKASVLAVTLVASLFSLAQPANSATSWENFNCQQLRSKSSRAFVANGSNFDVIVYGGSPAGVAAAKAAAQMGQKVLMLSESGLFGGAISNGVSATDLGSPQANVGYARQYLLDLLRFYRTNLFRTEPKVAECIFLNWLDHKNITLDTHVNLESAMVFDKKIRSLSYHKSSRPKSKITVFGKSFVDASYAGDLMFESGAETRLGMADYYDYNENVTKSRKYNPLFKIKNKEKALRAAVDFDRLPHVTILDNLENYKTDILQGMPSFTYRLCVTKNPENKIPFKKAPGYEQYVPAWQAFMKHYVGFKRPSRIESRSNGTRLSPLWRLSKLPNRKWDLNAYAASFTNLTMSKEFFDQPANRDAILAKYANYLKSFLYFVQNDSSVPSIEKRMLKGFGLCADEFTETGGWPEQPYLREGRRLVGKTTITVNDIFHNRERPDAIASGSYPFDSKPTLFVYADGVFARDRWVMYRAPIYEIPMSALLPKNGLNNLIVPVGVSASPSAYGSIRMEPQYISMGQASGIAAALASKANGVISLNLVDEVRSELRNRSGFTGIKDACERIPSHARKDWGFDPVSCNTVAFPLTLSK